MLDHGGNLHSAIERFGIPKEQWIDLSTGINPHPYPAPALLPDVWHRLPEPDKDLIQAAHAYYGVARSAASAVLPVAGSQAAIQGLPQLRVRQHGTSRVMVANTTYAEHAYQWQRAGHMITAVPYGDLPAAIDACDVMVVCNPNNPTGESTSPDQLLQWAERLAQRGGWLIVDEAFGDVLPKLSVAGYVGAPGLIVLRSIGKFFGLAGLRLGFVLGQTAMIDALAEEIGPWSVSGPAQQIGTQVLTDRTWQRAMQVTLQDEGQRLTQLLAQHGFPLQGCALFRYWPEPQAAVLADFLARQGIWIRLFSHGVRLGLPADEKGWQRLESALASWKKEQR
ncbi:MAG: threonine-phosphate decarboxylase CobD [Oxalicibacterium faecigallinarum]|uniref:threonine-phosphate decarboxylase CobD n=1 Tax=Oxalicibacterium faecigallinarum TaxID=573741 RepID=UPI0028097500|nr:threonine-phosphate decarboxylase CobD [Oxalicibacterium faecigallinarum]MDQ7969449.1 threonine-phosphate decarboxylase CobD [Oxalicibacterium faecigallinarum]